MSALAVAEQVHTSPPPSGYDHLTPEEVLEAIRLKDAGLSEELIAQQLGCHRTTVNRQLRKYLTNTTDLAKRVFHAGALEAADRVMDIAKKGKDDVALRAATKVLEGSGVLSTGSSVSVGVQVVLGQPGSSALDAAAITVTQGNHNADYQTQRESVGLTGQALSGSGLSPETPQTGGER